MIDHVTGMPPSSCTTVAHEIEHFLGLSHTFAENCPGGWGTCELCDDENLGDYVDDTPKSEQGSCTLGRDTCPNRGHRGRSLC